MNTNDQKNHLTPKVGRIFEGMSIVYSGVFSRFTREELKITIENLGGDCTGSVSGKTKYLIAGENMGPAKLEKAKALGVPIISEEEFLKMIGLTAEDVKEIDSDLLTKKESQKDLIGAKTPKKPSRKKYISFWFFTKKLDDFKKIDWKFYFQRKIARREPIEELEDFKAEVLKDEKNVGNAIMKIFDENMGDLDVWGVDHIEYNYSQLSDGRFQHTYNVYFFGSKECWENPFHIFDMSVETDSEY